jgi:type I restriction enzyme, S subunit
VKKVPLGEFMPSRVPALNPAKFQDEEFELWSIPAFDLGEPERLTGSEIGSPKKCVQPKDVLLSRIVPHIRRSWIVGQQNGYRQIASGEWIIFRSSKFFPPYLRHVLISDDFHARFMQTVAGVGGSLLRARPEGVKEIEIPLPPLEEQKRIAAILDQADSLRRLRRRTIDRLNTLGQAIFYEMFLSKVEHWPEDTLLSLGQVITGSTPPTARQDYFEGDIPFVTPGDLESDCGVKRTLSEEGALKSRTVEAGAVLVCCIGATIGKIDQARERSAFNQQINAVHWGKSIEHDYGLFALRNIRQQIIFKGKGASTTLPILKKSEFQKLKIPVPPKDLQLKFSNRIRVVGDTRRALRDGLESADALFSSVQHRAFRGEL